MFFPKDEEDDRKAALKKLMGIMNEATGKKLGEIKGKPVAASMTIEKVAPHMEPDDDDKLGSDYDDNDEDDMLMDHDDSDEENKGTEPSPEEKMMIEKLYHKYCM